MVKGLWRKFDSDWGWNLARLLAYTFLTALFAVLGLILIVLAFVLHFFGSHIEQDDFSYLFGLLPNHVAATAAAAFAHSLRATPESLLLLGVPVALWYSTRFFVVLESCLCVIFRRERRTFLRQNRMALGMLGVFLLLLPIIVFSVTLTPHLLFISASARHVAATGDDATLVALRASPLWTTLGILGGLAANFTLLLLVYTRVTPGFVALRAAWPGALLSATLAQGYLLIFPLYTRFILQPDHFGSIAGFVLVSLVFFFAYGFLIVLGAEVASWRVGMRSAPHEVTSALAHLYQFRLTAEASSAQQKQPPMIEIVHTSTSIQTEKLDERAEAL